MSPGGCSSRKAPDVVAPLCGAPLLIIQRPGLPRSQGAAPARRAATRLHRRRNDAACGPRRNHGTPYPHSPHIAPRRGALQKTHRSLALPDFQIVSWIFWPSFDNDSDFDSDLPSPTQNSKPTPLSLDVGYSLLDIGYSISLDAVLRHSSARGIIRLTRRQRAAPG